MASSLYQLQSMWSSARKPLVKKKDEEDGDRWTTAISRPIRALWYGIIQGFHDLWYAATRVLPLRTASILVDGVFSARILKRVLAFQLALEDKRKKLTASFIGGDAAKVPKWAQKTVTLPAAKRGCHLVTPTILKDVEADLAHFQCGLAHFFLQHTSASLTINENYDSDVLDDVETWLTGTVPEGRKAPWKHTIEGPDDMPAHIKSSVFGCSLSIPITDGRLNLGTWQIIDSLPHFGDIEVPSHGNIVRVVSMFMGFGCVNTAIMPLHGRWLLQ